MMRLLRKCLRTRKSIGLLLIIFVVISVFYVNQEQADFMDRPQALGLLVNTSGYALPEYDPWDPTLRKILAPGIEVDCTSGKHPLTSTTYKHLTTSSKKYRKGPLLNISQGHLVYHREHEGEYSWTRLSCCYQVITRGPTQSLNNYTEDTDSRYKVGPCIAVKKAVTPIYESFIYVKCQNSLFAIVYSNVHHFIQQDYLNSIMEKKLIKNNLFRIKNGASSKNSEDHKPLSVMLMGLDSTSRNNLRRYLPKTFSYLKDTEAIDLLGYNKVGDNTFPNLLPLLSGRQEKTILKECTSGVRRGPYDKCPFLWKNYSSLGYITAFGEDSIEDGTFNYVKTGYVSPPTDLYLRPFIQASEDLVGFHDRILYPQGWCLGPRSSSELVFDSALNIIEHIHEVPSFSLFWTTRYTHDNLELANAIDESTRMFLKKASKRDDLILIFLSDHGIRFGDIRQTIIGKYEENMPFFFVLLPQWFRKNHKLAYKALQKNQKRLVTPQDIHATLLDILQEKYKNIKYLSMSPHRLKDTAMSLFKEIPKERSCDDASVPYNFCSGILYDDVYPYISQIVKVANFVISYLNEGLLEFDSCVQLNLLRIIRARQGLVRQNPVYSLTLVTSPGNAMLEATVKEVDGKFEVSGEVSRINRYGLQSMCIDTGKYKKYCFCRYFRYIPFMWNKNI